MSCERQTINVIKPSVVQNHPTKHLQFKQNNKEIPILKFELIEDSSRNQSPVKTPKIQSFPSSLSTVQNIFKQAEAQSSDQSKLKEQQKLSVSQQKLELKINLKELNIKATQSEIFQLTPQSAQPMNQKSPLIAIKNFVKKPSQNLNIQQTSRGNTKVVARFRPLNEMEKQFQSDLALKIEFPFPESVDIIQDNVPESFTLDRVFPMNSAQAEIFEYLGVQTLDDILQGYNGTIFAYGQTGSGKTHTMMGGDIYDEMQQGIIPRSVFYIFEQIQNNELDIEFTLKCSMLEIYKEMLRDLINPDDSDLKIKESPHKGIYVDGLTETCIISAIEMLQFIEIGNSNRIVAKTGMNKQSSRSHSLFILEVYQKLPNGSEKNGILNLVDLAGSEKVAKSKVQGQNLEEAKKINLSLSALGNVIHALTQNADHIPYRDSKLTRLLQHSLGGNYKTSLIVACSPSPHNIEETLTTLKFAKRAKQIKNKPRLNIKRSPSYYIKIIKELKQQIQELQGKEMNWFMNKDNLKDISKETLQNAKTYEIFLSELNTSRTKNETSDQISESYDKFQDKEEIELKLQSLKAELESQTYENEELKLQVQELSKKLNSADLKLIEAENRVFLNQQKLEQQNIQYQKAIQANSQLEQAQKFLQDQINNLNQCITAHSTTIQSFISQKSSNMGKQNEISISFVQKCQKSCIEIQQELQKNEQKFQLDLDKLVINTHDDEYLDLLENNLEDEFNLEYLKYQHRNQLQQAFICNSQLIHALYVLNWKYD